MNLNFQTDKVFPFEHYSLVESEDSLDLQSAVSKEIANHSFSFLDECEHSRSKITCVRLSKTVLFGVGFGSNVHASTEPINALQLVAPLAGQIVSHSKGKKYVAGPNEGVLLKPNEPVDLDWREGCVAIVAWVDQHFLSDIAQVYFGQPLSPLFTFPSKIKLNEGVGLSIANNLQVITNELEDENSLFSRGITNRSIEEILLTSLLFTSSGIKELAKDSKLDGKSSLNTALEYIYANIEDDITTADLVRATGVSLRKLQYDFAKQLGVGPMAKIRQEKLIRARNLLKKSDPKTITVADVAAIWGFFDRRYFTKIYKNEFGEWPSITLNRPYMNI